MIVKREIGQGIFLFIENDSLLWGLGKKEEEFIIDPRLRRCLEERVDIYSNRLRIELVELHLTERCNLRCNYCYVPYDLKNVSGSMDYSFVKDILEKIYLYAMENKSIIPRIMFHGGEPLIKKRLIMKIVDEFRDLFKFSIQTNGLLLDDEMIDFVETNNVSIGVSIDAEPNNRGVSNKAIYSKLKGFKSINKVGVVSTITKYNIANLVKFIEDLYSNGIRSVVLNPVSPEQPNAVEFVPDISLLISEYKNVISHLIELNKKRGEKLVIDNVEGWLLPFISDYSGVYCRMAPCGAGRLNIVITPNGDVYPCSGFVGFKDFVIGNIKHHSLERILNSKKAVYLRKRNVDDIYECRDCAYKRVCGANCIIPLLFLYNDINRPSYYCRFYQSLLDFLFLKLYESMENIRYLISDTYLYLYIKSEKYQ